MTSLLAPLLCPSIVNLFSNRIVSLSFLPDIWHGCAQQYCPKSCASRVFFASVFIGYLITKNGWIRWWRHQMETYSALLSLCAGNSPVAGEFPTQRPVTRSFDVFFVLTRNKWLSEQSWGWWFETPSRPLWHHRNENGVFEVFDHFLTKFSIRDHETYIGILWVLLGVCVKCPL